MTQKTLFCFGYGYSCDYLGHALLQTAAWSVAGTTRDEQKRDILKEQNVEPYLFDYNQPLKDPAGILKDVTHLLISTPPGDDGDPAFLAHGDDVLKLSSLEWVGYLSTTGVYGDRAGDWVDETSSLNPTSQRGARRKLAEEQWLSLYKNHNLPVHIFRLSGIYGPGRSALDSVRAGSASRIHKPGHAFSRIHVEDIVNVVMASFAKPNPGAIYNVCDDFPTPSHEVIAYACEMLGFPVPDLIDFKDADLAPITRSFYRDNKRVKNDRIKNELGVTLKYKSFKEGLKACKAAEDYAVSLFKSMSAS